MSKQGSAVDWINFIAAILRLEYESRWRKPSKFVVNLGILDRWFVSIVPGLSPIQELRASQVVLVHLYVASTSFGKVIWSTIGSPNPFTRVIWSSKANNVKAKKDKNIPYVRSWTWRIDPPVTNGPRIRISQMAKFAFISCAWAGLSKKRNRRAQCRPVQHPRGSFHPR